MALVKEGNGNGIPQGQAAPARADRAGRDDRYDPVVLHAGIASTDWRAATTTTAIGLNVPAVQAGGLIRFFQPFNGDYISFKEGGKVPFECTFVQARIVIRAPFTRSMVEIAAVPEHVVPRGAALAQIIGRSRLTLRLDKIPMIEDQYVDTIGQASGVHLQGAPVAGGGILRGTDWPDAFPLPEPIEASPAGPSFEAQLQILQNDLLTLGVGVGALGIGSPWEPERYIDALGAIQTVDALPIIIGIEFFGQRGLNIKSGQVPMPPGLPCYYPKGQ